MSEQTKTRRAEQVKVLRNPAPDTALSVAAGTEALAEWDFFNDTPDVAAFALHVEGLPDPSWAGGVSEADAVTAAPSGGGVLRLTLTPPADAAPGDYALSVAIVSGGSVVGQGVTPLTVRVTRAPRAAATKPKLEADASNTGDQPTHNGTTDPAPRRRTARTSKPHEETVSAPEVNVNAAEASKNIASHVPALLDSQQKVQHYEQTPAIPEEPLQVVDFSEPEAPQENEVTEQQEEPSVVDPKEGAIIALCPGETKLVRFSFVNDGFAEQTYILDEDRSLDTDWITLVQDQVNLTRNGRGEVALRLSPPRNAEPGDYPFNITVGLQGGTLTTLPLYLSVLATPAVRLTTKTPKVSIGVLSGAADFVLNVESAGNADTAFRLAVQSPTGASDSERKVIHESGAWRYLFDHELDSLRSPGARRSPPAVPVRLRLERRGVWWFGFRETHQVHVVAVPVTEPTNNEKPGNTLDLTAVRRRPWPLPGFLLIPILALLLLLLAVGPGSLSVANSFSADNNRAFVLGEAQGQIPGKDQALRAVLAWQQPFYAFMNLDVTAGQNTTEHRFVHNAFTDTVSVPSSEYYTALTYEVKPLLRSGGATTVVYFVPARTDSKLSIANDAGQLSATQDPFPVPGETTPVTRSTINVTVPASGAAHLYLKNLTSASKGYRIDVFFARIPSQFLVSNVTFDNANVILPGESLPPITIERNPASPPDPGQDYDLTLVTTDRAHQILRVKLKAE